MSVQSWASRPPEPGFTVRMASPPSKRSENHELISSASSSSSSLSRAAEASSANSSSSDAKSNAARASSNNAAASSYSAMVSRSPLACFDTLWACEASSQKPGCAISSSSFASSAARSSMCR